MESALPIPNLMKPCKLKIKKRKGSYPPGPPPFYGKKNYINVFYLFFILFSIQATVLKSIHGTIRIPQNINNG